MTAGDNTITANITTAAGAANLKTGWAKVRSRVHRRHFSVNALSTLDKMKLHVYGSLQIQQDTGDSATRTGGCAGVGGGGYLSPGGKRGSNTASQTVHRSQSVDSCPLAGFSIPAPRSPSVPATVLLSSIAVGIRNISAATSAGISSSGGDGDSPPFRRAERKRLASPSSPLYEDDDEDRTGDAPPPTTTAEGPTYPKSPRLNAFDGDLARTLGERCSALRVEREVSSH
jgi:hypothetical protein